MDPTNDIYHKEEPPLLVRRKKKSWRPHPTGPGMPPPEEDGGTEPSAEGPWMRRSRRRHSHVAWQQARATAWRNRAVWYSLCAIVGFYLLVLAITVKRSRNHPRVAAPVDDSPSVSTTPFAVHAAAALPAARPADGPLEDRIRIWRNGARAVEDTARLQRDGSFDEARASLEKALDQSPLDFNLRFALARVLMSARKYEDARAQLLQVVASDPGSLEARQALADTLAALGASGDARLVAEWVLDSDPYSWAAHRVAAQACLSMNDPDSAIEHLRRMVNMNHSDKWALNNLGQAFLKTGQIADARGVFEGILKDDPNDSAAYFNLAICEAHVHEADRVVDALSRAAATFGDAFVKSWLVSPEFDGVRATDVFAAFQTRLNAANSGSTTNAPSTTEPEATSPAPAAAPG